MADEPENLVLQVLRRFDSKRDRLVEDVHDVKVRLVRLTAVWERLVGVQRRIDRVELRVDRIEGRLDLVEQPH